MPRSIINFAGTCPARATLALASKVLQAPFRTETLHLHFAQGCYGLLHYELYISSDAAAPATGRPTGLNLLAQYGQAVYIRGDGLDLDLVQQTLVPDGLHTIQIYADNADYYDHNVEIQIEISLPPEGA